MIKRKEGTSNIVWRGREITAEEIEVAKDTTRLCSGLARRELAETICEHWGWVTATGSNKVTACLSVLEHLEENGILKLPVKNKVSSQKGRYSVKTHTARTSPPTEAITGRLNDVTPVQLEIVVERNRVKLLNEYIDRHHYLGYSKPFGCTMRYFISCDKGLLGCMLVAGASKAIKTRDDWIGWSKPLRQSNLPWMINNTRFLIFPWVKIEHLASHALGQLAKRIQKDWQSRWGYEPLLMETYVDPARYSGICYKAAGWIELGKTSGRGLRREGHSYKSTPKLIYVKPLSEDFREQLCSGILQGRVL
jgi:hypothetical protein